MSLDQIVFCNAVVFESICFCTRAKRLKCESNTIVWLRKNWTGWNPIATAHNISIIWMSLNQIVFCDSVVFESICFRTRAKRLRNNGNTTGGLRKIWTGVCEYGYTFALGSLTNPKEQVENARRLFSPVAYN